MTPDIAIPDSQLAREITELVRDTASPLLFHHSSRVFHFAALAGRVPQAAPADRKSTRLNSSHYSRSRMPSSA